MPSRHFLHCLGHPALFTPAGELVRFRTKKHLALLVYVAVEADRSHRRDRLAELLWPRAGISEARHSLATTLSVIHPRLGDESRHYEKGMTNHQLPQTPQRQAFDVVLKMMRSIVLGPTRAFPCK